MKQTESFGGWLRGLRDVRAKERIALRLSRVSGGLFGDAKSVGDGVLELRIDHGPGYRIYFTQRGDVVLLLLHGRDKGSQRRDIARAKRLLAEWSAQDDDQDRTF